jgi:hypothetical protein
VGNEGLQTEKDTDVDHTSQVIETTKKRQGRIRMGIQRTLPTARFESVVIHYEIDEEIAWDKTEERYSKVMNWEAVLAKEFKVIHDKVLEELELTHKRAYFKDNRPEPYPENRLDDLDSLD